MQKKSVGQMNGLIPKEQNQVYLFQNTTDKVANNLYAHVVCWLIILLRDVLGCQRLCLFVFGIKLFICENT